MSLRKFWFPKMSQSSNACFYSFYSYFNIAFNVPVLISNINNKQLLYMHTIFSDKKHNSNNNWLKLNLED